MSKLKIAAYSQVQRSTLSSREAERLVFAKAVFMLREAKKNVHDYGVYSSALKFNQMLWTLVQADLMDHENQLSEGLKTKMLSLSLFVDKQTITALARPKAVLLDPLINIDENIAGGLLSEVGGRGQPE